MCVVKVVVICLRCSIWLTLLSIYSSPATPISSTGLEVTQSSEDYILVPLLKVLMDKNGWDYRVPRKPDAKYLKYMKRLYTMSATQDGIPKRPADHRYNTVRLLTPRAESRDTKEAFEQDVFYGLGPVSSREQLLRSVLLYSVNKSAYFPILCHCNLTIQDPALLSDQMCSNTLSSHNFRLRFERRKRHKWAEVDLASFLQPFVGPHRGNLHIVFNYICAKPGQQRGGRAIAGGALNLTLMAPSLLLFLNDTREQAHHSWLPVKLSTQSTLGRVERVKKGAFKGNGDTVVRVRSNRRRRGPSGDELGNTPGFSIDLQKARRFQYPDHECQLHDFRLSFSQLRWDRWIIAPHDYNPRYCKGSCPRALSHRYGSPVHTLIQNILYEKVDSSIPRPSCVPSKYNPLSVLTLENDGSIVYKEYEDMIATTCTCR
ncbi:growth/differentiation factor 9 [Heptranchias perlo]|uniref:growth/differentiation factor 9 n=1 Tax=Heptranchias perlo TaxID=212740 RepID=UPI003559E8B4